MPIAPFDATYTLAATTVTVAASAAPFASAPCYWARFTARDGNAQPVCYGGSGVTTAAGKELSPGATSGWLPIDNTNQYYYIGANSTDKIDVETLS